MTITGYVNTGQAQAIAHCRALSKQVYFTNNNYWFSMQLFNHMGLGRADFGHPGVAFNAKDERNYDFVYFRYQQLTPAQTAVCYIYNQLSRCFKYCAYMYICVLSRPHSATTSQASTCYQLGYVAMGERTHGIQGSCLDSPPGPQTWFEVKVSRRRSLSSGVLDIEIIKSDQMVLLILDN